MVFFVTSSDSGSLVVDMLASGGDENPPIWSRVFFSVLEGAVAGVLLWSGARSGGLTDGLSALQTMAILVAAPFSVIMIGMCVATARSLHQETVLARQLEHAVLRRELALEAIEASNGGR